MEWGLVLVDMTSNIQRTFASKNLLLITVSTSFSLRPSSVEMDVQVETQVEVHSGQVDLVVGGELDDREEAAVLSLRVHRKDCQQLGFAVHHAATAAA